MADNNIQKLKNEAPCVARVADRRGAPRLIINDRAVAPFAAWSWGLIEAASLYRDAGIRILHPILGLNIAWPGPDNYDFSEYDELFDALLAEHPGAYFLPRVLLDVPSWWIDANPDELIRTALPRKSANLQYKTQRLSSEGGMLWTNPVVAPSLASSKYVDDMQRLYTAMLQHFNTSPLSSRIIGYQIGAGVYGEWHYSMSEFMADTSGAVERRLGPVPSLDERLDSGRGLLRDPLTESKTINFYRTFHETLIAPTLLKFASITKQVTERRLLCGAFYGYLLENVWIQEGGHLAPEAILNSSDIDFLASPFTYQTTNIPDQPWWNHDIVDGVGNYLGRARGVGGDGGYRVLLESLRRHGKLFFVEADSGTHLAPEPGDLNGDEADVDNLLTNIGGEGSQTLEGALRVLKRDLGRMWAGGSGGWLFDFGSVTSLNRSWYDHPAITDMLAQFARLMGTRDKLDLNPVSEVAAVYDAASFFYTRHWRNERPLDKPGSVDYFVQWFLDSQARSLHRIGAPVDYLYRFDLIPEDAKRYKLIFFFNTFVMDPDDVANLRAKLRGSGTTVVWMYAPGFLTTGFASLENMSRLTGFEFKEFDDTGPMLIDYEPGDPEQFGTGSTEGPRFSTTNHDRVLGVWSDNQLPAFSIRQDEDGWTSVYCGTAPLPNAVLRHLLEISESSAWSSKPDIVVATRDTAMIVSTDEGERTIRFPHAMRPIEGTQTPSKHHELTTAFGDVNLFVR